MHPFHTLWHPPTHSHTTTCNPFSPSHLLINPPSLPSFNLPILPFYLPNPPIYPPSLPYSHVHTITLIYPLSLLFFSLHTISPIYLLATITITPITHIHWHTPATPHMRNLINSPSLSEKWSHNGLEIGRMSIGILNRPRSTLVMGAIKFPRYIFTYVRLCIQYGAKVMTSVYPASLL